MSLFALPPEKLLHFVWQGLRFDIRDLRTTCGLTVKILHPGTWNHDQGPDFLHGRVLIDGVEWFGQIELHVEGEDWYRHGHETDEHYNSVVLHVVHKASKRPVTRQDGTTIPEVVIGNRISPTIHARYREFQLADSTLACASRIQDMPSDRVLRWLDRLSIERMEDKAARMQQKLQSRIHDWHQVLWEEMAAMLGGPVNADAFRDLARRVSAKVMNKEAGHRLHLEAMLYGAAGMLTAGGEAYVQSLRAEWQYLQAKHQIQPVREAVRFLRMRPSAFPTLRLSQLADIWHRMDNLMPLLERDGIRTFLGTEISASNYWRTHYRFGEKAKPSSKNLGRNQKGVLVVNVLLPLGWLYQIAHGRDHPSDWLEEVLLSLPPENNRHIRPFTDKGWPNGHALHSQAMVQLHKQYCVHKRCLDCHVGQYLLEPKN